MKRPNSLVSIIAVGALSLSAAACADLLGIDDFEPPPGAQPPSGDVDSEGAGGAGGAATGGGSATLGTPSWAEAYGAGELDRGHAISVAAGDAVMVSGVIHGRVDFGGGRIGNDAGASVFVSTFDSDGGFVSSVASGGSGEPQMAAMAGLPSGAVVAGHYSDGDLQLGSDQLAAAASGANNLFVARVDAGGSVSAAIAFASDDRAEIHAVAVDPSNGEILIGGIARGAMSFGSLAVDADSDADAFVAKLGADLQPQWVTAFQAPNDQVDQWVSTLAHHNGRWFAAGRFAGQIGAGGEVLSSQGIADAFLIELDGAGDPVVTSQYGGSGEIDAAAMVATDEGVVLAGHFTETVAFGGEALSSAGASDIFVASLASGGETQWSASFGGTGADMLRAMARDQDGAIVLAGSFSSILEVGALVLESAGGQDALVLKIDAQGSPLWAYGFGRNEADEAFGVAFDSEGSVLLTGAFSSGIIIDEEILVAAGSEDVFVAKFAK
jgi:hypothetical protein